MSNAQHANARILVLDDAAVVRHALARRLTDLGAQTMAAARNEEALGHLLRIVKAGRTVDAIVQDHERP